MPQVLFKLHSDIFRDPNGALDMRPRASSVAIRIRSCLLIGNHSSISAEESHRPWKELHPNCDAGFGQGDRLRQLGIGEVRNRKWFARSRSVYWHKLCRRLPQIEFCQRCARGEAEEGIRAVIAGGLPSFGQKYPCHSREQERWFIMTVTRASTGSDVVIVHNDVTQLVQAERGNAEAERRLMLAHERFEANRALAESEERFRKIVDTAIDAIVIIDDQGRIQSLNHAAERISASIAVRRWKQRLAFHGRAALHVSGASAGGQVEGHRKDGSTFPVKLCVAAWRTAGKRYFAGIMRDITKMQSHS